MSNDIAIRVENLSKRYPAHQRGAGRIGRARERHDTRLRGGQACATRSSRLSARRSTGCAPTRVTDHDDTIWALRDVSFEVQRGKAVAVIGRNGAGG